MTRQSAEAIEDEAAGWIARLDRHGRTPELMAELDAWLAGDDRRRGALLQAQAAWALIGEQFAAAASSAASPQAPAVPQWRASRRRLLWLGGGAALAASVAGGLLFLPEGESYATRTGEIRRVPLADGSVVAINTASRIRVALEPGRRVVRIAEGEAWFQVAPDKARPFIAEAGQVRVRAVGTAFSVRRREGGTDILVTEGVVEAWSEGGPAPHLRLAAGQRAFLPDRPVLSAAAAPAASPHLVPVRAPDEINRTLAWRAGQIDLAGESLEQAIAEFNRYNARKLVLADPALAREPLHGVFRTDDPQGFAEAVRHGFQVPVAVTAQEIRIGR